jgi:hypothetical protein
MIRVEIIGNRSIQEDLEEFLKKNDLAKDYTLLPEAQGRGNSGPKQGDNIWPEENFIMVVYCEQAEAKKIKRVVQEIKEYFPDEGIKIFAAKAEKI